MHSIKMTELETDEYILNHKGCPELDCSRCFYSTNHVFNRCNITKNMGDNITINVPEYRYNYVVNKMKLKRLKEILK